ncbi:MAG TPA: acetyl-CoA carboxylase biotin carboxyl carrier protein subunit [Bacteroidales bacterium]|nr:acetyl-CoA carboxylase biotin carboxyl carrier protein subunit [Bacteroidales bacterium]HNZ43700.1 acetyl-CoA carboxylase biotin carboxyl carrier protein subunit [Bacteroidales bacterium]HOH84392.1 acetyl-CoA carboxylase biotin carboxyl carrier protein subunit [Bacteroidales bacterium]HQP16917.1 acetyl-CoA carboxylase biotin carboxyl carrier protein subunit [Bacteroidales bacterium]
MKNSKKSEPNFRKLTVLGEEYTTLYTRKYENRKPHKPADHKKLYSFIPGKIKDVFVEKGVAVSPGDKLLILEAMKMDNEIIAPVAGTVKKVYVVSGQMVAKNELLIEIS